MDARQLGKNPLRLNTRGYCTHTSRVYVYEYTISSIRVFFRGDDGRSGTTNPVSAPLISVWTVAWHDYFPADTAEQDWLFANTVNVIWGVDWKSADNAWTRTRRCNSHRSCSVTREISFDFLDLFE